jgi:signal transduction histidine kinase
MGRMIAAAHWRQWCISRARGAAASRRALAVVTGVLVVAAAGQAIWAALTPAGPLAHAGGLVASVMLLLPSLAATLPLGLGWAQPAGAAITIYAANLLSLAAFGVFTVAGLVAQLVMMYRLGRRGPRSAAAAATTLGLPTLAFLALALVLAADPAVTPAPQRTTAVLVAILAASLGPAAAAAGAVIRSAAMARQDSLARAAIAGTLLEHTARGERARISRELHDVVAHHISMIAVQAETARLATPGMPAAGADRLSAIGDTARAALTEMRRLLGVLREDAAQPAGDLQPQPGLAQLNQLLDVTRDTSGIGARLIVRGWLRPLDPGVELAAYRIVQEALTNARRHAAGAAVDVELQFTDERLELRIRDNGPGPPTAGQAEPELGPHDPGLHGHGLLGMRERAAAVGGELHTGPAPGGGFLVKATLPAKSEEYV